MPTQSNLDAVFLELGRATYTFQAIEARIKFLLPHLNVAGEDAPPSGEGWKGWRMYLDSKEMLGNLVRLLLDRVSTSDPVALEREWREVVQGRNDVVHNFAFQAFARCSTPEDIELSVQYLRIRRRRALPLLQMLEAFLYGFNAAVQLPPTFEGDAPVELPAWLNAGAA